jgi:RNA polymerase sigma factor (sigma-70 family)
LSLLSSEESYQRGFSLLVKTYQERLYWHVRGMVGVHEDADEVLQNTFIKVYKGIANFQGNSKLYTWLYRIATNEALTFLEKRKRQQTITLDDTENGLANTIKADSYIDPENLDALLRLAIQALPDKQRQVFLLRYYEEMPYDQISEITETSVGGLKASYHHAAKKIEAFIKNNM